MPSAVEASGQQSQIEAALFSGLNQLSAYQKVEFARYKKFVLSQDGFVFWVRTGAVMVAQGSLHYATDREQGETATTAITDVIFSSESEVTQLSTVSPDAMWIGSWPIEGAPPLRVAFSHQAAYFRQADTWHYSGVALLPVMSTQILNSPADLPAGPIVSNSLPIWLAQNSLNGQSVIVAPSFAIPDNLAPPYIAVHIEPSETEALGAFPVIGPWPGTIVLNSGASPFHDLASSQLCRDEVTLTLYGFSNDAAWQYWVSLIEASRDGTAPFGFANSPVLRDEKQTQSELTLLAQKKTLHISANYLQGTADAVARRLILSAMLSSIEVIGGVTPTGTGASTQAEQTALGVGSVYE